MHITLRSIDRVQDWYTWPQCEHAMQFTLQMSKGYATEIIAINVSGYLVDYVIFIILYFV